VLAAEFLKNAKQFVEDGVNSQLIIRAYTQASREVSLFHSFFINFSTF
jgi:chaperonin GroEL (HSP60 family)